MNTTDKTIRHVMIVGGGSAGWLTAAVLAAEYIPDTERGIQVTLVESPDVPTVGVGEGTWPSMRGTLKRIGVSETEFLRACDASFKQGSRFIDWIRGDGDEYFHPFTPPVSFQQLNLAPHWQKYRDQVPFADAVCGQAQISREALAPKMISTAEYAFALNYGYHLDAGKFAAFLQRHCTDKLGVRHLQERITDISGDTDGYIESLTTESGEKLTADLFVDCSGSASLLIGKHYGIPLRPQQQVLFNDRALAVQVAYPRPDSPIASCTHSTARAAGWVWDIGLPSRRGVGYTYSSAHTTDAEAEQVLREYIDQDAAVSGALLFEPRQIKFDPGYREKFWHRNCVAIGMAAGFIEPLEASALVMVEKSAQMLAELLPPDRAAMDAVERRFNRRFSGHWQRIIEFLKLHYVISQRSDSDYWLAHRNTESIPQSLKDSLEIWRYQPASLNDARMADELFPAASYQYVLSGMEFIADTTTVQRQGNQAAEAERLFRENARQAQRMSRALPSNRALLQQIGEVALPTI
ncbi:2-polyprenyl-6-methoxyphenol hydroxylase [Microbulbifer donghaiensis]|uniref:2-polyprenyl-6-methoxyphenol hydroxylase n=1 Tax=Microbulbifer donghaiensis TaxID=494016 RepID=A0A1M5B552_9GAMM|nr:tryptophan halogenase family protein [Microbulbifer donghaiensis]SHF37536.1 2-polyprenyl-6-methoxyphenol hydroxylase [Microbulbifer donghaiensis]